MRTFSITVDVDAPPRRVVAVLTDVERWPEWTPTTISVERKDSGLVAVGSRALVRQPKLRPAIWEVTELDERTGFTWVTHSPGVHISGRHRVDARGSGSRVTLTLEFSGLLAPLVARYYRDLNQRYLAAEANGLKQRSESYSA